MILVSPGHYSAAQGAKNHNGFSEYPETRVWARKLVACLGKEHGMYVGSGKLGDKVETINRICKEQPIKLAIEVHFNAAKNFAGEFVGVGSETLYCPGSSKGKSLALKIQNVLGEQFPPNRGVKEGWYRRRKTNGALFFLKKTDCPAVIIEPEFIQFEDRITSRREQCCHALAQILKTI